MAFVLVAGGFVALVAVSIFGARRYIRSAKNAEAPVYLRHLAEGAAAAHARDGKLCPSVSHAVPSLANVMRAARPEISEGYHSAPSEWTEAGFECLGFHVAGPEYFNYDYQASETSFVATARGAPQGEDKMVTLTLSGHLENGTIVIDPDVVEQR